MKKSIFYLCLLFIAQTAFAADSLYVREQQIPILIDRTDNVLLEMRIPAQKGDVLNNFTLQFGEETNLSDIKAVRLFYSGTEAPSREGTHFNPVTYVTSYTPGKTRVANPSYSVKQDEVTAPAKTIRLSSKQPMIKGPNYFWVSIEMKPETSLLSRVSFTMPEATINNKPAAIEWKGKAETPRRVGVGVRQAGDDGSVSRDWLRPTTARFSAFTISVTTAVSTYRKWST